MNFSPVDPHLLIKILIWTGEITVFRFHSEITNEQSWNFF